MLALGDSCMKITIDTKEDNHEDIRKVISLLSNLIGSGGGEIYTNQGINQNTSAPTDSTNLMSMFGDAPTTTAPTAGNDSAPNFGSFLNLVDQKSGTAKKEEHRIEFY